jgi:hypothetical protein
MDLGMNVGNEFFDGQRLIPSLLRAAPQVRPVLDRYGLRGCGGPLGPVETLEFFARAHDVPLTQLLVELRQAAQATTARDATSPGLADSIYRPFFTSGIVVALTLGAVWGAYLLLRIGFTGKYASAGLHEVNAHGHAQIFGWVGLFVMGFAYQAFPRFKHTSLARPRLALFTLGLMLIGIVGRSTGEPMASTWSWAGPLAVGCSVLEVAAISIFAAIILATWRTSGKGLAFYDYYILCSLFWFVIQSIYETVYLTATLAAIDREELLALVSTWQAAMRDIQIHGFALLMILGVSQRIFPNFYGFSPPSPALSLAALVCLNLAVLGESTGLVLLGGPSRVWAGLWYGSVLLLAVTAGALVWNWKLFGRASETDRSLKFLRAAYAWLLLSLAMLVLLPVYQFVLLPRLAAEGEAVQIGFSHAYYGAIRHAITVGFISLMIMGVAAKVVPTLSGVDVNALSGLWAPFLLVNVGCATRVGFQTLTDSWPGAFPLAGVSGLLEVLGLSLWAIHLGLIMAGRARLRKPARGQRRAVGRRIEARDYVGEVMDLHPDLLATFIALGFTPLANPLLRQSVARFVTIGQACRQLNCNPEDVIAALNQSLERTEQRKIELPVLPVT